MHDGVIGAHRDDAIPETLVADATDAFLADNDAAVATALTAGHAVPEQQQGLRVDELGAPQTLDNAGLRDGRVGRADAAPEVRRQVRHGQIVRDERERRGCGEPGAVARE